MACIESQSIVVKDKQSYYHLLHLHVSVKAYFWCVIQIHALYVNGIVGRDLWELFHLGPFVVLRQDNCTFIVQMEKYLFPSIQIVQMWEGGFTNWHHMHEGGKE